MLRFYRRAARSRHVGSLPAPNSQPADFLGRYATGLYLRGTDPGCVAVDYDVRLEPTGRNLVVNRKGCRMNRAVGLLLTCVIASGVQPPVLPAEADEEERRELREQLEEIAVIEKKMMVPMRDGVRLATDIYRPS